MGGSASSLRGVRFPCPAEGLARTGPDSNGLRPHDSLTKFGGADALNALLKRFFAKVSPEPNTGCWLWLGAFNRGGYGSFGVGGSSNTMLAHRFIYEAIFGPVSYGLVLDHLCRQRACVNPAHLEPVTNRENVLRGVGASAVQARKTHCNNGHPLFGENLRLEGTARARRCKACELDKKRRKRSERRAA